MEEKIDGASVQWMCGSNIKKKKKKKYKNISLDVTFLRKAQNPRGSKQKTAKRKFSSNKRPENYVENNK